MAKITEDDILSMARSDIRYALYRCKRGNPDSKHKAIYKYYKDTVEEIGLGIEDFASEDGWDVNKKDNTDVVTGKLVRKYIKDLHAPVELTSVQR